MAIAIIMENARVYCCQGILNCHMTFAGSVISLARPESWPRIVMISKKLAIVTIRISATPPSKKKYVWLARLGGGIRGKKKGWDNLTPDQTKNSPVIMAFVSIDYNYTPDRVSTSILCPLAILQYLDQTYIASLHTAMADKTLKKVEDQLNCSICLDTYTDPKLLQCFHVYCQGCLAKLVVRDQQGHLVLTCPICRQVTPIPANGVTDLQPAFHINHLLDILDEHKNEEGPTAERDLARLAGKKRDNQLCSEHVGKALELYCETCEELICFHGIMKKGKHHSHDYEVVDEAFEKYKEEIMPSLEPMEKRLVTINKALAQCDSYCVEVSDQRAAVEADIHKTISRLQKVVHEALEVRKTELINRLHQMTKEKLKDIAVQRDQIETTQAQLGSCIDFIKESFKTTSSQGEVLRMKTSITQRAKELITILQPDILEKHLKDNIVFSSSGVEDIPAQCRNCGQVSMPGLPDPSQCYTTHNGVQVAAVGEKCTVTLQAIDCEGKHPTKLIKSLESELASSITGARVNCTVERRGQSQYNISYQPTIKGRHQLHVKVEGQHVRGSPYSVTVKSPVVDLTAPIKTIQWMSTPTEIAINKRGELVVIEHSEACVSVFTASGEKIRSFGTRGSGKRQFENSNGVAVDSEGNIFVADTGNNRIQKFTEEGLFLREVDCKPNGIAFNSSNGKLYVSDLDHYQVVILNSDLTFSSAFGGEGKDKGKFECPGGIAFDSIGNVFVADVANSRIQVFTAEGKFLRIVEKSRGELMWPVGVAVNTEGVTFISENWSASVSVFDHNGYFMSSCGGFSRPCDLAVDDCGVLYVCDSGSGCILMF